MLGVLQYLWLVSKHPDVASFIHRVSLSTDRFSILCLNSVSALGIMHHQERYWYPEAVSPSVLRVWVYQDDSWCYARWFSYTVPWICMARSLFMSWIVGWLTAQTISGLWCMSSSVPDCSNFPWGGSRSSFQCMSMTVSRQRSALPYHDNALLNAVLATF